MEPPTIPKLIIPKLVIRPASGNEVSVATASPLGFSQLPASLHSTAGRLLEQGSSAQLALSTDNSLSLREMVKNLVCLHLQEFESYLDVYGIPASTLLPFKLACFGRIVLPIRQFLTRDVIFYASSMPTTTIGESWPFSPAGPTG